MATPLLTSEELVNIKHTVLTIQRQEIARNIDPKRFFGHLRSKYIFDESDCDEIRAVPSRVGSAELFVDTLKRKGGRGYDEFCSALLNDKTQMFLLQRLTQTLELLRAKVSERKKSLQQQLPIQYPAPHHPIVIQSTQLPLHHQQQQQQQQLLHPQLKSTSPLPSSTFLPTNQYSNLPTTRHHQLPAAMPTNTPIANQPSYPPAAGGGQNTFHATSGAFYPQSVGQMNNPHRPLRKVQSRQSEKDMMLHSGYGTDSHIPQQHHHHCPQPQPDYSHNSSLYIPSTVEPPLCPPAPLPSQNQEPQNPVLRQQIDSLARPQQQIHMNPFQHHHRDNLAEPQYNDWHSPTIVRNWRSSLNGSPVPSMYPARGMDPSFPNESQIGCGHSVGIMNRTGEDMDGPCGQMILARGSE